MIVKPKLLSNPYLKGEREFEFNFETESFFQRFENHFELVSADLYQRVWINIKLDHFSDVCECVRKLIFFSESGLRSTNGLASRITSLCIDEKTTISLYECGSYEYAIIDSLANTDGKFESKNFQGNELRFILPSLKY